MIKVYDRGRLVLICASKDWRLFLPGVADDDFRWVANPWARDERWTWSWV
jgi:hypothetical protein